VSEAAWWKGWAVPLVVFEDSSMVLRVATELPAGGFWDTLRDMMGLRDGSASTEALFLFHDPSPPAKILAFQMNMLPIDGGVYVDRIYTPFQHDPKRCAKLRGAMLWVLFDMLDIDTPWSVSPPRGIAATPQAELFLPRAVYDVPLVMARQLSDEIGQLQNVETSVRPTTDMLTLLRNTDFITGSEWIDDKVPDMKWFQWRVYLGGPKVYQLIVEASDNGLVWSVASSDGMAITDDFEAPLDALLAVPIWWPKNDPDGYIEAFVPTGPWAPELQPVIESYLLLGEMPLAWPNPKFREWAEGVGLL